MNTYMENNSLVVKLTATDVEKALEEFEKYVRSKGETFKKEWMRFPTPSHFLAIYFGNSTKDNYVMPDRYICNSNDSAKKLFEIVRRIEFPPSPYDGTSCEVKVEKKTIDVIYTYPELDYK